MRINISGCMNACGHYHAGHIGILGVDEKGEEFFQLTLGGSGDQRPSIGQILGPALPEHDAVDAVARVIDTYLVRRDPSEQFIDTHRRLGAALFKEAVYAGA